MIRPLSKPKSLVLGVLLLAILPFTINWSASPGASNPKISQSQVGTRTSPRVVPGVIVIKLKSGAPVPSAGLQKSTGRSSLLLRASGVLSLKKAFPAAQPLSLSKSSARLVDVSQIYFATIGAGQDPVAVAHTLDRSGEFEYAEPKYMNHIFTTPNDPDYANKQASYFNQMNAPAGWTVTKGDTNVIIADVDGGTYWQHPDLLPNVVTGWNFVNNSNNAIGSKLTSDNYAHGTATASHFGAATNNGVGMAGTSWNCRLMPINASSPTTDGDIEYGYEGIQFAYTNGAKVINCSWGRTGSASKFEQDIINAAAQAGALIVAAAGNDASSSDYLPEYPANYQNLLPVGAVYAGGDSLAYFSNYGLTIPVYAPGTNIWSALTTGSTGNGGSGTSYASPLTAGLVGLVKSLHPTWTPQQVATQIRMTSDSIGSFLGHGRINFGRALTETHAGLQILSSSLLTPQGGKLFLPGDTVVLNMTVQNVLFSSASNLSFFATTTNTVLQPLQGATGPVTLAAGDSLVLPQLLFTVGSMDSSMAVLVRIDWTDLAGSVAEHDAYDYRINVFPTTPLWTEIQTTTLNGLTTVCAVDRNTVWTAGGDGNATSPVVLRSLDGGSTWTDVTGNLPLADFYCITAVDSSRAWVGTGDGRIFATTNGGTSWSAQTYPGTQSPFIDGIKIFPNLTGFAVGDPGSGGRFVVLSTTNGGSTWSHLANEPVGASVEAGWNNAFCWTDQIHGWFGTNNSRIWRTTNGGATWSSGSTPSANSYAVSFADSTHGLAGFDDGSIASTSDGGATWSTIETLSSLGISCLTYVPGTSYAWTSDGSSPYISTDRGSTWTPQTSFPFSGSIQHVAFVDTTAGWMVTSNGEVLLYQGRVSTSVGQTGSNQPTSFVLEQNYPNPFNPLTTIRFQVPSRSRVKLTVYNILGQQVAEVVNKEFGAGTYAQVWGGNVASGIYFYRIEATSLDNPGQKFVSVKKMVLIK